MGRSQRYKLLWCFSMLARLAFLTSLVVPCWAGQASSDSTNLLSNPGFEGPYRNGIAAGWRDNSGWADVDVDYLPGEDADRGASQRIISRSVSSGAIQFVQPHVRVEKGKSYVISLWMKGDVDGPVEILLRKHGSPYTTYARKALRVGTEWRHYQIQARTNVDDPAAFFMVRLTGRGELWLDDVSMKMQSQAQDAVARSGNLIANGSFEVGIDRWAVQVREAGGYRHEMPVSYLDVRPTLVSGDVPHGQHAMKIEVPRHGRMRITTPPFETVPGDAYTVSLWIKAASPRTVLVSLAESASGANSVVTSRVQVTRSWERRHFTTKLRPSSARSHYLIIEGSGQGTVLVDGIQVQAGVGAEFSPARPTEVGFARSATPPIFYKGQPIALELCLAIFEPANEDYSVLVTSTAFDGSQTVLMSARPTGGSKRKCLTVRHPSNQTGYFRLRASVRKRETVVDRATIAIGIVPQNAGPPKISSPFGGHARFNPTSLEAMKMLGVSWLRLHPPLGTKWFVVEPEQGQFEFIDAPIRYAKKLGFNILGSLDTTPRWASSAPSAMKSEAANGFRAYPPTDIAAWENYVATTVSHFRGVIDHWEIWNEPDSGGFLRVPGLAARLFGDEKKADVYVKLAKSAYREAKRVNPDSVVVVGAGTGHPPVRWIDRLFENGISDHFDVLSFHYYTAGRPVDVHDVPARERVNDIRTVVERHATGDVRLWETESGFPLSMCSPLAFVDAGEYCASREEAVAFLLRNYFEWIGSGVERWFFYHMFFPDRTDRTRLAGFFEWDRSPTALAVAYAVLSDTLRGMEYLRSFDVGSDIAAIEFASDEAFVTAYWLKEWASDRAVRMKVEAPGDSQGASILDAMGVEYERVKAGQSSSIEIGSVPVYKIVHRHP